MDVLGVFAEEMLVHQNGGVKVADEMPLEKACLIGCGITPGLVPSLEPRPLKSEPGPA